MSCSPGTGDRAFCPSCRCAPLYMCRNALREAALSGMMDNGGIKGGMSTIYGSTYGGVGSLARSRLLSSLARSRVFLRYFMRARET